MNQVVLLILLVLGLPALGSFCDGLKALSGGLDRNLLQQPSKNPEEIADENRALLGALGRLPRQKPRGQKREITEEDAESIYQSVAQHTVASLSQLAKYDPDRYIGYCFGRAAAVHFEATKNRGIPRSSILKLWAIGTLESVDSAWQYHVTALARGKNKIWWTIDPIMGKPLPVDKWYRRMRLMNPSGDMKLEVSDAKRATPLRQGYQGLVTQPLCRTYFLELFESFSK